MHYDKIAEAIERTGMVARGGFVDDDQCTIVIIGNIGGAMWPHFESERPGDVDPLDVWTRAKLAPIAADFGAEFVHPSDEPFQPFQRWAQRADEVWQSPIGLLVHREHGLWHAYRGAFIFSSPLEGLPSSGRSVSPCVDCADQPCLSACPVGAFTVEGYDATACRSHIGGGVAPDCLHDGCDARRACPVAKPSYGPAQMEFHMRAFVGFS